jgi:hypothetical protein
MVVLLGILVASFFYLRVLARRIFFEAGPHPEEAARTQLSEVALQSSSGPNQTVTLYFLSPDRRQLLPEKRPIALAANDADRIRQILLALVEGSRAGAGAVLPPSTEARAVFLTSEGTAYLDFSTDALANLAPGIASETLTVYSITNSLAENIPAVKRVKILIQGQEVETLDGHADLSDYYLPDPALNAPDRGGL